MQFPMFLRVPLTNSIPGAAACINVHSCYLNKMNLHKMKNNITYGYLVLVLAFIPKVRVG